MMITYSFPIRGCGCPCLDRHGVDCGHIVRDTGDLPPNLTFFGDRIAKTIIGTPLNVT